MNKDTIGLTSKTSAAARAYESEQPDALFVDPLASIYANQDDNEPREGTNQTENTCCCRNISLRAKVANASLGSRRFLNSGIGLLIGIDIKQIYQDIALRTRFLDDVIEKNIANVKQIVLLACGGDFRPYRLPFLHSMAPSDLTFYLLDVPHVLKYRNKCLKLLNKQPTTPCKVVEIPADLSNEKWSPSLREAGFSINQPTLWLAEGFFHYLTEQQIGLLFNRLQQLSFSKQTSIAFDLVSTRFQSSARHASNTGLFRFALDDENEVRPIFSQMGCFDIQCTSFEELGKKYGRNVSRDRSFIVEAKMNSLET